MKKIIRFLKWLDNLLPEPPKDYLPKELPDVDDKFMFMLAMAGKEKD